MKLYLTLLVAFVAISSCLVEVQGEEGLLEKIKDKVTGDDDHDDNGKKEEKSESHYQGGFGQQIAHSVADVAIDRLADAAKTNSPSSMLKPVISLGASGIKKTVHKSINSMGANKDKDGDGVDDDEEKRRKKKGHGDDDDDRNDDDDNEEYEENGEKRKRKKGIGGMLGLSRKKRDITYSPGYIPPPPAPPRRGLVHRLKDVVGKITHPHQHRAPRSVDPQAANLVRYPGWNGQNMMQTVAGSNTYANTGGQPVPFQQPAPIQQTAPQKGIFQSMTDGLKSAVGLTRNKRGVFSSGNEKPAKVGLGGKLKSLLSRKKGPDSDGDGIPDKKDNDDDNDGIPDSRDKDANGDGIRDHPDREVKKKKKKKSKKDSDGDGIPDKKDKDDDNDGIPDTIDDDDDGDGILDKDEKKKKKKKNKKSKSKKSKKYNKDSDGDGIPDRKDRDDDNDGIPDRWDNDDDGDGIPDSKERKRSRWSRNKSRRDSDGDGIPDSRDRDDDNDGIPDSRDGDDDGDGVPDWKE